MSIQPRNDYLLVEREETPQGLVHLTDADKSLFGKVICVGPGRWVPGEWWKTLQYRKDWYGDVLMGGWVKDWEWIPGHRKEMQVRPGMRVCFNSHWNDFAADHYDDLPLGHNKRLHLIQEGDIFSIF